MDFDGMNSSDLAISDHTKQLKIGSLYQQVIDEFFVLNYLILGSDRIEKKLTISK